MVDISHKSDLLRMDHDRLMKAVDGMLDRHEELSDGSTRIPHRNYRRPTRTSDTVPRPPSRRSKRISHYPKNSTAPTRHPRETQSHS